MNDLRVGDEFKVCPSFLLFPNPPTFSHPRMNCSVPFGGTGVGEKRHPLQRDEKCVTVYVWGGAKVWGYHMWDSQ